MKGESASIGSAIANHAHELPVHKAISAADAAADSKDAGYQIGIDFPTVAGEDAANGSVEAPAQAPADGSMVDVRLSEN